jgi:hypothetical protein
MTRAATQGAAAGRAFFLPAVFNIDLHCLTARTGA